MESGDRSPILGLWISSEEGMRGTTTWWSSASPRILESTAPSPLLSVKGNRGWFGGSGSVHAVYIIAYSEAIIYSKVGMNY